MDEDGPLSSSSAVALEFGVAVGRKAAGADDSVPVFVVSRLPVVVLLSTSIVLLPLIAAEVVDVVDTVVVLLLLLNCSSCVVSLTVVVSTVVVLVLSEINNSNRYVEGVH